MIEIFDLLLMTEYITERVLSELDSEEEMNNLFQKTSLTF